MVLAYCAHKKADYDEDKSFCSSIWDKRAIFSQILLHLFDTATDLGVLIDWGILAQKESDGQEIESIDMGALFLTAITFLILYRLISTITAFISGCRNGKSFLGIILDGFLGLLDMYVLKTVYKAIKDDEEEPSIKQRMLQLSEAIFESLPQV